jgi:hypothetical protein
LATEKEVILKSILTIATGFLILSSSQLIACPLMEGKQKVTELDAQDQTQLSLAEQYPENVDIEKIDPALLAKLLLEKQEEIN